MDARRRFRIRRFRIRPVRIVLLAGVLALAAAIGLATPASAHARLDHSTPASGARLTSAPDRLVLAFSEGVQASPQNGLQLMHADGTPVSGLVAATSGQLLTARIPARLTDGIYVVRWRVLSNDGHVVHGEFTFTLGAGVGLPPAAAGPAALDTGTDPGGSVGVVRQGAETAGTIAVALTVGGLALWLSTVLVAPRRRLLPRRQIQAGGWLGAGAALVALGATVAQTDTGSGGPAGLDGWQQVLRTPSGQALLLRLVSAVAVAVLARAGWWRAAAGFAVLAVVAVPLAGHASTDPTPALAVPLLVVHVLAAAAWAGALVALLPLLRPARRAELAATLPAVSAVATGSVAVLVLTGIAAAWRKLPDLAALTGTRYGVALIIKVALLVGLLALGVVGWRAARRVARLAASHPAGPDDVRGDDAGTSFGADGAPVSGAPLSDAPVSDAPVSGAPVSGAGVAVLAPVTTPSVLEQVLDPEVGPGPVRRTLRAEVVLLTAALVTAAVLATLPPPAPASAEGSVPARRELVTSTRGRAVINLHPGSATLGLDLTVTAAGGAPEEVVAVTQAAPAGTVIPPTALPLQRLSAGRFTADPVPLAPPGRWDVTVGLTYPDGRHDDLHVLVTVT
jgi:copper transport protein